jgi:nitrogen fixation NifU-like protein
MTEFDRFLREFQAQFLEQVRQQYSEKTVEHWLHPRNPHAMEKPDGHAVVKGPCGDTMEIFIRVRDGKIIDASFITDGCITTVASASMAVEMATGKEVADARTIFQEDILENLGGLPEESQHCALLASKTLQAAIIDYLSGAREAWKKLYRPTFKK